MITMKSQSCATTVAFMGKYFPVGLLCYVNLLSLMKFLSKLSRETETEQGILARDILNTLF